MEKTIVDFVKVLRTAEVKVSPAETLDVMAAIEFVGYEDRALFKNTLSMLLAKNPEEKETFETCFEKFFTFDDVMQAPVAGGSPDEAQDSDAFEDENSGNNPQGQPGGKGSGQGSGNHSEAEDAESGDEETPPPTSPLGQLLLQGTRSDLMVAMAEAGRAVEVNQIVVFTQKGLYTRKIMDQMGLKGLQEEITERQETADRGEQRLAGKLKRARDQLRDQVRDYVEKQFFLHADEHGKQLREELLKKVKLSNLEKRNHKDVQEIVFKMAKKLVSIHSKRRKTHKRGQLDIRKTLRHNMQ